MDKKEIEVQKALGTMKREKYRVAFVYRRRGLPEKYYYTKQVLAYSRDDAISKVMVLFVKDPLLKRGALASHKPYKPGKGFNVLKWDKDLGRKGDWKSVLGDPINDVS